MLELHFIILGISFLTPSLFCVIHRERFIKSQISKTHGVIVFLGIIITIGIGNTIYVSEKSGPFLFEVPNWLVAAILLICSYFYLEKSIDKNMNDASKKQFVFSNDKLTILQILIIILGIYLLIYPLFFQVFQLKNLDFWRTLAGMILTLPSFFMLSVLFVIFRFEALKRSQHKILSDFKGQKKGRFITIKQALEIEGHWKEEDFKGMHNRQYWVRDGYVWMSSYSVKVNNLIRPIFKNLADLSNRSRETSIKKIIHRGRMIIFLKETKPEDGTISFFDRSKGVPDYSSTLKLLLNDQQAVSDVLEVPMEVISILEDKNRGYILTTRPIFDSNEIVEKYHFPLEVLEFNKNIIISNSRLTTYFWRLLGWYHDK